MIVCPNCGHANSEGSRFCANCGADLSGVGRAGPPTPGPTPAADRGELPPTHPEWRMSPAGPLPEPPRRRRWLWVVLGIVGACLVLCCLGFILLNTLDIEQVNDFMTRVSDEATHQAGS